MNQTMIFDGAPIADVPTYELTVSTTAVGIAAAKHTLSDGRLAVRALITNESAEHVRYAFGTDPTTDFGHIIRADGGYILLTSWAEIKQFAAIRDGSSDATLTITLEY